MANKPGIILVAEDSPPNRTILIHLLKKMNFEVVECKDGQHAMEELKNLEKKNITVLCILSDIMMPKMDGIELLRQSRSMPRYQNTPFVFVTAISDKAHIMKAREYNVNGYILKPVAFQRVHVKLKELFPDHEFPAVAV